MIAIPYSSRLTLDALALEVHQHLNALSSSHLSLSAVEYVLRNNQAPAVTSSLVTNQPADPWPTTMPPAGTGIETRVDTQIRIAQVVEQMEKSMDAEGVDLGVQQFQNRTTSSIYESAEESAKKRREEEQAKQAALQEEEEKQIRQFLGDNQDAMVVLNRYDADILDNIDEQLKPSELVAANVWRQLFNQRLITCSDLLCALIDTFKAGKKHGIAYAHAVEHAKKKKGKKK